MWGANHSYKALEPKDKNNDMNFLVIGPWFHSQVNREGHVMGPFIWDGDTTADFRSEVLFPFFNQYLTEGAPKANTPPVLIYNTRPKPLEPSEVLAAELRYRLCEQGPGHSIWRPTAVCPSSRLLSALRSLTITSPIRKNQSPIAPAPWRPTMRLAGWNWLVQDQRFVDGRPDVLTYMTEPRPLRPASVVYRR